MSLGQEIMEEVISDDGKRPLRIWDVVRHPDGRTVKILRGQWWGTYGLSNFWYWSEVMADGTLGPEENGYGWYVQGEA